MLLKYTVVRGLSRSHWYITAWGSEGLFQRHQGYLGLSTVILINTGLGWPTYRSTNINILLSTTMLTITHPGKINSGACLHHHPYTNVLSLRGLTTPYKNTCYDYLLRCLLHGGTRGLTAGYKVLGGTKVVYNYLCWLSWNLGASTSRNHQAFSRSVMGLLYL